MDLDRKRASPTESAVMRDLAVGTLRSWYAEAALRLKQPALFQASECQE